MLTIVDGVQGRLKTASSRSDFPHSGIVPRPTVRAKYNPVFTLAGLTIDLSVPATSNPMAVLVT
jgi:hypothetical protein